MAIAAKVSPGEFAERMGMIGSYFGDLHRFALPIDDYHAFYLFWWFAWSIMIGQFTSRFVGGLKTWQVLGALLVFPSIPLAIWFAVLYSFHEQGIDTTGFLSISMVIVGITFVVNSLDSLVRLYTDNLALTPDRLGRAKYIVGNVAVLCVLTLLFQLDFLQIQWVGSLVIGLYFGCFAYILLVKRREVAAIDSSPPERVLDFEATGRAH